ncbi:MAG: hypothetical protein C0458_08045 [Methylobacterium sp.]|nr:hypothetical protein [Methylobacterium sp.]
MTSMSTSDDRPPITRATIRDLRLGAAGIVAVSALIGFRVEGSTESVEHLGLVLLLAAVMVAALYLALPPSS